MKKRRLFYGVGVGRILVSNSHLIHCKAFTPKFNTVWISSQMILCPERLRRGVCSPLPRIPTLRVHGATLLSQVYVLLHGAGKWKIGMSDTKCGPG